MDDEYNIDCEICRYWDDKIGCPFVDGCEFEPIGMDYDDPDCPDLDEILIF